jgi:hypothetical protein
MKVYLETDAPALATVMTRPQVGQALGSEDDPVVYNLDEDSPLEVELSPQQVLRVREDHDGSATDDDQDEDDDDGA